MGGAEGLTLPVASLQDREVPLLESVLSAGGESRLGTLSPKMSNKSLPTLGKAFFFDENLGTKNNAVSTNVRKRARDPTSSPELC